jgi:asparagine synthase (glutamine-hydrolysing)
MPIADWLIGPLRDWAEALLDERRLRHEGMLEQRDPQEVGGHLSKETQWDYDLWTVLMFQAWLECRTQVEQPAHVA